MASPAVLALPLVAPLPLVKGPLLWRDPLAQLPVVAPLPLLEGPLLALQVELPSRAPVVGVLEALEHRHPF